MLNSLKGRLYYIKDGQRRYDLAPINFYAVESGGKRVGTGGTLLNDGVFIINNIPRYRQYITKITVVIEAAKSTQFLNKNVEVVIDPTQVGEISAGEIRLDTADGLICNVGDTNCLNSKPQLSGSVQVIINDGATSLSSSVVNRLSEAFVKLANNHVADGDQVASITTDKNGYAIMNDIKYGPYTVIISKLGYLPRQILIDVQEPLVNLGSVTLDPTSGSTDSKIVADMKGGQSDLDLIVQMKSDKGNLCEITPWNKYCPWSSHLRDVTSGSGEEVVSVRRLAVANYNAYVKQAGVYQSTCKASDVIRSAHTQQVRLSWKTLASHKQGNLARPISAELVSTRTLLSGAPINSIQEQLYFSYPRFLPVETDTMANLTRIAYTRAGVPLERKDWFMSNSYYRDLDALANRGLRNGENVTINVTNLGPAPATGSGLTLPSSTYSTTGTPIPDSTLRFLPQGSYLWASCFNGFGYVSLVEHNMIVDREPNVDDCAGVLRNRKPDRQVQQLREKVNKWISDRPTVENYD